MTRAASKYGTPETEARLTRNWLELSVWSGTSRRSEMPPASSAWTFRAETEDGTLQEICNDH
jgi:hypothetical protein